MVGAVGIQAAKAGEVVHGASPSFDPAASQSVASPLSDNRSAACRATLLSHEEKLSTKIKAGTLLAQPTDENPFADWSAHLFLADRTQYILLSNTKSLYSTVMYGKGITDDSRFIQRALSNLREFMEDDGLALVYHRFIAPASASVRFAKALDRSVTGSMNELIVFAKFRLADGDISPFDVGFKLNDVIISSLSSSKFDKYAKPKDAFQDLVDGVGANHGSS